jgi:hypothetical protein
LRCRTGGTRTSVLAEEVVQPTAWLVQQQCPTDITVDFGNPYGDIALPPERLLPGALELVVRVQEGRQHESSEHDQYERAGAGPATLPCRPLGGRRWWRGNESHVRTGSR